MPNRDGPIRYAQHRQQLRLASGTLYTVHTLAERPPSIKINFCVSTLDDEVRPGELPSEVVSQERRFVLEEERDGERYYRETPLANLDERRGASVQFINATTTREEMTAIARDHGAAFFRRHLGPRPQHPDQER